MTPRSVLSKPYPKRMQRPDPIDPVAQAMLGPLALPDESAREAAVGRVRQAHSPAGVVPLIDALVELLGRDDGPVRRQALAYLARFGPLALPSLHLRFAQTRSAWLQRGIAEALALIAGGLGRDDRIELLGDLAMLSRLAVGSDVGRGLGEVFNALRRASGAAARAS
jgi:hypothetical protein